MAKQLFIDTVGCQMNMLDSEMVVATLRKNGYELTSDIKGADTILFNTCSVRERAEEKLYHRLSEIRHLGGDDEGRPVVAVAGCVAQQEGEAILSRDPIVDVVVGTQSAKRLPVLVDEVIRERMSIVDVDLHEDVSFPLGVDRLRGFLPQSHG